MDSNEYYAFLWFDDKPLIRPLSHMIAYALQKTPWRHRVLRLHSTRSTTEHRICWDLRIREQAKDDICANCGGIGKIRHAYAVQTGKAKREDDRIHYTNNEDWNFCVLCDECFKKLLPSMMEDS